MPVLNAFNGLLQYLACSTLTQVHYSADKVHPSSNDKDREPAPTAAGDQLCCKGAAQEAWYGCLETEETFVFIILPLIWLVTVNKNST